MEPACYLNERIDSKERQTMVSDARKKIHEEGYVVGSTKVESILKPQSMLPVEVSSRFIFILPTSVDLDSKNAFSRLSGLGFNVFGSLVVDLMHEFELGVWKSLFIHLIRILEAEDRLDATSASVSELDRRCAS
jgi:hypothetical protein